MVLGRSTTLRRDESFKAPFEDSSRSLLRSISLAVKGRGSVSSTNVQAVQRAVRRAGWATLKGHVWFYGKYLVPEIAITVLMFASFAVMSGLVPYVLCRNDVRDSMSTVFGFDGCVLRSWRTTNTITGRGAQIFWLLFWAIQYSWMSVFPTLIAKALCPTAFQRRHNIQCAVCCALPFLIVVTAVPTRNWSFDNAWLLLVSGACSGMAVLTTADVMNVQANDGTKLMGLRWLMLMALSAAVCTLYIELMPSLITLRSNDPLNGMGLALVRLVIHPIIWNAVMMLFRQFMWHRGSVPDLMQVCFMLYPALYSSIFGRFLLLQLNSVGSVFLINFMQCAMQLAGRLTDRGADDMWRSAVYGARGSEALNARNLIDEMRMVELFTTSLAENGGIVAASALMSLGHISTTPGQPVNHVSIWINAIGQLVTGFTFDFVGLCVEAKYHGFDWAGSYPKSIKKVMKYVFVIIVIGSTRLSVELLLLFCPSYSPETGVILNSCDKPSIFQAVNVAFAARNRGVSLSSYLNINSTSGVVDL